jgi:lipopolysaccharide transport system ATP-binding protein
MANLAIRVENVGKKYRIGTKKTDQLTMREAMMEFAKSPIRRFSRGSGSQPTTKYKEIWALKDVSFDVKVGEVVGVIGSNGAGKSTLFKILSRITKPTTGLIDIYGRVGSLLEVGTGFHQELTGRENVYLNGTILGMQRTEIERRFDEIVAFSGIEKFIDTPVKFYSSGMYVRLAFSVAAHLEAEIMLVDEVLSVGDLEFRQKCLRKIDELAGGGRTVLFISHNLTAVKALCERAMWLVDGHIAAEGEASTVVDLFSKDFHDTQSIQTRTKIEYPVDNDMEMQVLAACLAGAEDGIIPISSKLTFHIDIETRIPVANAYVCLNIRDQQGRVVYWSTDIGSARFDNPQTGQQMLICECPSRLLVPGRYSADISIMHPYREPAPIFINRTATLDFELTDYEAILGEYNLTYSGFTAIPSNWTVGA